jgi:hypothetical protein
LGLHIKVMFVVAVATLGIAIGVMGCALAWSRFSPDTVYMSAFNLALASTVVVISVVLHGGAAHNRAVQGVRITKLERAWSEHKAHDREALEAAVRFANGNSGTATVTRIGG